MLQPSDYTISIKRGHFEGELCYEARIKELPDVAEYADSHTEAYDLAIDTIETTAEIFKQEGRSMPEPALSNVEFSGRITLRLSKTLHRLLAEQADDEVVSLNQHIVNQLSFNAGLRQASQKILPRKRSAAKSAVLNVSQVARKPGKAVSKRAAAARKGQR